MKILRRLIFIGLMVLLGWLFLINIYQINISSIKNEAFKKEQIMEIENSNSISELKKIAKSKVYTIGRIHQLNDEKCIKELYILFIIISLSLYLFLTEKPSKTHNS